MFHSLATRKRIVSFPTNCYLINCLSKPDATNKAVLSSAFLKRYVITVSISLNNGWVIPHILSDPNECGLVAHMYASLCYYPTKIIKSIIHKVINNKRKVERREKFLQPQFSTDQSHEIKVFSKSNCRIVFIFGDSVQHS